MNQGVQILLARMESHPQEFDYFTDKKKMPMSRWDWIIQAVCRKIEYERNPKMPYVPDLQFLTDAEVHAIYEKFMSIQGDAFTRRVMTELLDEVEDNRQGNLFFSTTSRYSLATTDDSF